MMYISNIDPTKEGFSHQSRAGESSHEDSSQLIMGHAEEAIKMTNKQFSVILTALRAADLLPGLDWVNDPDDWENVEFGPEDPKFYMGRTEFSQKNWHANEGNLKEGAAVKRLEVNLKDMPKEAVDIYETCDTTTPPRIPVWDTELQGYWNFSGIHSYKEFHTREDWRTYTPILSIQPGEEIPWAKIYGGIVRRPNPFPHQCLRLWGAEGDAVLIPYRKRHTGDIGYMRIWCRQDGDRVFARDASPFMYPKVLAKDVFELTFTRDYGRDF